MNTDITGEIYKQQSLRRVHPMDDGECILERKLIKQFDRNKSKGL